MRNIIFKEIQDSSKRDEQAAMICAACGLFTASVYHLLRFGLGDNEWTATHNAVGLLFFLIFMPVFLKSAFYYWKQVKVQSSFICLVILVILVLLGLVLNSFWLKTALWLVAFLGVILFLFYLFLLIRKSKWKDYVIILPLTLIFALTNTSLVYGNFVRPNFFEGLIANTQETWRVDTLYHTALAQMINTYGTVTTGLDGIPFINYHFGSHFVFANLSNFLQVDLLKFYCLVYPVVFVPLFFYFFFLFIFQLAEFMGREIKLSPSFLIIFIGLFCGLVERTWVWDNQLERMLTGIVGNSAITASESYLVSFIFLFALLSLLLSISRLNGSNVWLFFCYLCFVPIFCFIISLIKISTGYIAVCIVLYLFIRFSLYKKITYSISLIFSLLLFFGAYMIVVQRNSHDGSLSFEFFIKNDLSFLLGFFSLHYFWLYLLIGVFIIQERLFSLTKLSNKVFDKKTILIELIVVSAIAGFLPAGILKLGYNGVFFTEIQFFLSIAILVPYILYLKADIVDKWSSKIKNLLFAGLCVGAISIFYNNAHFFMRMMVDYNFEFRKDLINDTTDVNPRRKITQYLREFRFQSLDSIVSVYGKPVQLALDGRKEYSFLKALSRLNGLTSSQKSKTLIYIDYDKVDFKWGINCIDVPFLVPALSGMAQLDGMPAEGECFLEGYGMEYYKYKKDSKKPYNYKYQAKEFLSLGFEQLLVYNSANNTFEKIPIK